MGQVSKKVMEVVPQNEEEKPLALQSIDEIIGRPAQEGIQRNIPYFQPNTAKPRPFGKLGAILKAMKGVKN